ncbi:Non-ribosomal peptide synthetase [Chaetomidium leptoderma]|uniref:Non-ribosomal peptide synthetase n=1 Tax=Chaetomidium leptoderma TaxID=669021 RepID=A0AAN6VGG2_9PEZI|nr:Non-ribosomal peptide synthetase [Chaetomidium leptoderma]
MAPPLLHQFTEEEKEDGSPKDEDDGRRVLGQTNGHGCSSVQIANLGLDPGFTSTPTDLREETVLLSWLIVLLRTQEDSQISYEWAYNTRRNGVDAGPVKAMSLSANEVMEGLHSDVEHISTAISRHIATASSRPCSGPLSLVLSTGSLSQKAEGTSKDEPLVHLEAHFDDGRLEIRPVWHSESMLPFTVTRHVETLADTVKLCISNPGVSIQSLLGPTTHDLDQIWRWNNLLPPTYDFCMHDVISERAQQQPNKEAISSWDGSLTYAQIDRYSTFLARKLKKDLRVELHDFVPVCFEKSRWTIVAVLAVMKVGATMVMMDPTLPLARLQNMAQQVGAKAMVTSRSQHELGSSVLPDGKFVVVEQDAFTHVPDSQETLPEVPASALMYIIFTSGSTGTPKGVKISHGTYTSSAIPRASAVGYTADSRVLDFASYAFDVSIDSMVLTLANGGCLCIPSDEDRLNDINGVMRGMKVNYAGITPSVARILDLDVIASLSGLGLGGEAASARDVNLWGQHARIIIGYGPCECTIGCTINSSAATGRDYISIGPGNGAAIWVADPNDHETLMPVGAVGELLVEGPIVGQGYLDDPDKTAAAFIEDPAWLTAGHGAYAGRRGRLYKTGDLGRYDPDGSAGIVFVGRKDTQVKLRGQRVELGEIESQLRARLPSDTNVIAEVIRIAPLGSSSSSAPGQPTLVAFVSPKSTQAHGQNVDVELERIQLGQELREALSKADAELAEVLPRYMVPTAYIPVNRIPTLISGKTDRKKLRQFGAKVDLRELTANQGAASMDETPNVDRPLSEMEQSLRQAWSLTLKLDPGAIRPDDNFFALGGDSLAAMRLVSVCREQGLDLSVTSTFGHPTLSAMATVVVNLCDSQTAHHEERTAFCLIPQPHESAIIEASQVCGTEPADIEDMYPCTPTQESLFTFSIKSAEAYIAQRVATIPSHFSLDAWKQAWEEVVAATPILRSRLVHLSDHAGLGQVVVKQGIQWRHSATELAQYLETDRNDKMNLGQSLARYAIIEPPSASGEGTRYMVWTLHHAVYDGWSEPLILEKVRDALHSSNQQNGIIDPSQKTPSPPSTTMGDFVQHIRNTNQTDMQSFWRHELQNATGPQFPRVPSRDFLPTPDTLLERHISLLPPPPNNNKNNGLPFTLATLIRGAWALVASQYTGNPDVVFGETLTGRDISLAGVETVVGPLIATVPIRVRIPSPSDDSNTTVAAYLQTIQRGMLARTPFQHLGMQNIRRVSRDAQYACEAPMGLVIQPESPTGGGVVGELGFEMGDVVREAIHFNPYPLMLACGVEKGGFRVCASFDGGLVEVALMERILAQLETACQELARDLDRRVDQVPCLPPAELDQIWRWNREPPMVLDVASGRLRSETGMVKPGSVYNPRVVVPWVCDMRNPSKLSPIGCPGELWLEGAFLAGDKVVESPAWLVAGSPEYGGRTGRAQPTGDIVKLCEDGSLVYVGRKNENVSVQGHAADMAELEVHFTKYLPPSVRAAAVVSQGGSGQEIVVFVEQSQTAKDESSVKIMSERHSISTDASIPTAICALIPVNLAAALKRLDKFVQNSLASHLVPSAYVVIDKMPIQGEQVDRRLLEKLASGIPPQILDQLREGFQGAWKTGLASQTTTTTTAAEDILRSCWAKILGLSPEQIDVDDNFFRLGGDSVLAMKLVSRLRVEGHGLTVADIFRHMRLGDAAKVLKVDRFKASSTDPAPEPRQPYHPFSMVPSRNAEQFVAEVVRPSLSNANWSVQDVYPVTDSQALDIRATIQPPRTSIQYTMLYSDKGGFERAQLLRACDTLVQAHAILRTVFIEHESALFQVVLNSLDISVTIRQAENDDLERSVHDLCAAHVDSGDFRLGAPFFHVFLVRSKDSQEECLVIGLSHAQYDGVSLPILLRDLEALYTDKQMVASEPFSSYISQTRDPRTQTSALTYWRNLLHDSSLSILPGQTHLPPNSTSRAIFHSAPVNNSSNNNNNDTTTSPPLTLPQETTTTTANLLTAAWALVLARRLQTPDLTFGSITSGRTAAIADNNNNNNWMSVMGPCYQFTPVRVRFQAHWTAADLLQFVQQQGAESLAHDFVGFEGIARGCTSWLAGAGSGVFFDSVVHHQDWEDIDTMPFAGRECRVEVVNPHGDAAWPLKVVSFVKGGQMHVGVVGSEADVVLVDGVLGPSAVSGLLGEEVL